MIFSVTGVVIGLILLLWSADRFIDGAAASAKHFGMPPLLIGMVVVGFGTSAPEIAVSAFASLNGNPGIALGNAYGSNIANIALVLGLTALISPIVVESRLLRKELPLLMLVTALAVWQLYDGHLSRTDAWVLLAVFFAVMSWTIYQGIRGRGDALEAEVLDELAENTMTLKQAMIWLVVGAILLVISSRILVWGAVDIARWLGISDLIIGLTVIAIGTSLPELAAAIAAIRKNEHDLVLGNVLGSNLFNTLAVVGIAGAIHPTVVGAEVVYRDMAVMSVLTLSLFAFGYGFRRQGRINRLEGGLLFAAYLAYTAWLVRAVLLAQ